MAGLAGFPVIGQTVFSASAAGQTVEMKATARSVMRDFMAVLMGGVGKEFMV
jgi:uncharacterized protein YqfA (UPF0365 family)